MPTFPTLPATNAPTVATAATAAPATVTASAILAPNIVTPNGQTCICVPTGSCQGQGSPDGSGLIDIRIVTNVSVSQIVICSLRLTSIIDPLINHVQ